MTKENQIPPEIQSRRIDIREYEASFIVYSLIKDKENVLVVGDSWGRDYYFLTERSKRVTLMDIAPQSHLHNLIVGDITEPTSFENESFDAVLLPEVLEHLVKDHVALAEVRRILRDDGLLLVTVPFLHDEPEYHVRVHTRKSAGRLLQASGFQVVDYLERGGLISFAEITNRIVFLLERVSPRYRKKFADFVVRVDIFLGRTKAFWLLMRKSKYRGCYILAKKGKKLSLAEMNIKEFSH